MLAGRAGFSAGGQTCFFGFADFLDVLHHLRERGSGLFGFDWLHAAARVVEVVDDFFEGDQRRHLLDLFFADSELVQIHIEMILEEQVIYFSGFA